MATFLLPDLGEGLTEAEIVRWLVAEGDVVAVDQSIVEVETAKSLVEVPSPYAGRVETLHAAPGATVQVGRPLVTVAAVDREPVAVATYREEEQAGSGNVLIGYGTSGGAATGGRRRRPRGTVRPAAPAFPEPVARRVPLVVSPLVRNLARESGVDLRTVDGTGDGGVITRADVQRAVAVPIASGSGGCRSTGSARPCRRR
ncbi:hypothetical protein GCM10027610_085530 [Dactylosporangium cerinum]